MVSTASVEDLCRSTLSWLDQHCALPALRPSESSTKPIRGFYSYTPFVSISLYVVSQAVSRRLKSCFSNSCLSSQWFWVRSVSWVQPQPSWLTQASYRSRLHSQWPRGTLLLLWTTPYSPVCGSSVHIFRTNEEYPPKKILLSEWTEIWKAASKFICVLSGGTWCLKGPVKTHLYHVYFMLLQNLCRQALIRATWSSKSISPLLNCLTKPISSYLSR